MNSKQALQKIRIMLGMETEAEAVQVELAEVELLDGTIVKVEGDLTEGKALVVATEEGDIPAPEGVHQTKDNKLITVDSEGMITKIEEAATEVENEEMEAEEVAEESTYSDELIGAVAELIKPLNDKINLLSKKFSALNNDFDMFKDEPAAKKITNNTFNKEELKNENNRLVALASMRRKK